MNRPPQKSSDRKTVEDGHYAKKQIHCKSCLIAWSHQSRFDYGIKLADLGPDWLLQSGLDDHQTEPILR